MSVLQVANLHFNSVGSERIELIAGNVKVFTAGGFITETSRSSVFNGSTSEPLVRITQTGTGEAFRVEDSTNPDATPFIVDSTGNVGIGVGTSTYKLDVLGGINNGIRTNNSIYVEGSPNSAVRFTVSGSPAGSIFADNNFGFSGTRGNVFIINSTSVANIIFQNGPSFTERMRIDATGNLLIGRTNSTVGQNVKLDVNGAINTSSILVNGTAPFTTLLANTSVGTGTTYVINNTVITKPYKKIEIWYNFVSHNAGANRGLQIEWSVDNGTTILGPLTLGTSIPSTDFWSGVAYWINADDTAANAIRQYFDLGGTTSTSYTFTSTQTTTVASYINWFRISLSGGAGNLDNGTLNVYGYQ